MLEYYEFAKKLRGLARRADNFGYDRQRILEELVYAAENYEEVAERLEMDYLVQMQRDAVENDGIEVLHLVSSEPL
jgi:hypothetical protein